LRHRVLLRADYNVPVANGAITNDFRIKQSLPTVQALLQKYEQLKPIIAIIGENELSPNDRADYAKAKKLIDYFSQDMFVMEDLNGKKGEFIKRDQMLKGVEEIIV